MKPADAQPLAANPGKPTDDAVDQLLQALQSGAEIDDLLPACRPQSLAEARHIQDGLVELST